MTHAPTAPSQYTVCSPGTPPPPGDASLRKVAVFVTHGMGQQVPFATLDAVFERLRRVAPFSSARPEAETVQLDGQQMQRLVLRLPSHGREIHFYEGYWAPLTEGEVTLRDISLFLMRAGLNGILNSSTSFSRWIFGRWQAYDIPVRTWAYLVVALATIGSLALMNGVAALVSAARAPLGTTPPEWLSDALFCDLTTTLNIFLVMATVFVVTLGLSRLSRRQGLGWLRPVLGPLSVATFATTLLASVLAGLALPLLILSHVQHGGSWSADQPRWSSWLGAERAATFDEWCTAIFLVVPVIVLAYALLSWAWKFLTAAGSQILARRPGQQPFLSLLVLSILGLGTAIIVLEVVLLWPSGGPDDHWPLRLLVTWGVVLLLSGAVRRFLVQYLGDVVVYVESHTVDRFADLRARIRQCVTDRARAIYGATGDEAYDRVVVVGHSLGSVVSYDVLNQLLCEDAIDRQAGRPTREVAARTPLFLTFGSPLDKTSFIFAIQHRRTTQAREALAASSQPMLQDYAWRPERWVNIYSPWDIISGSLEYFDLPGVTDRRVVMNRRDRDATTLLMSHVEYWENALLPEVLGEALTAA
ncbi:MAG: hypothetical protein ACREM9_03920 [Gemmatimonadales bacterium]